LLRCLKADYADPMTDDRMVLIGLIEKSVDTDLVARGVRDPARQVQSNGYWSAGFFTHSETPQRSTPSPHVGVPAHVAASRLSRTGHGRARGGAGRSADRRTASGAHHRRLADPTAMRISVANLAYHLVPVSPFHAVNSILGALIVRMLLDERNRGSGRACHASGTDAGDGPL
jgi:hypothetical protein